MSLKDALAGIKEAKAEQQPEQLDIEDVTGQPIPKDVQIAAARVLIREGEITRAAQGEEGSAETAVRPLAKRVNPDYEHLHVLVRKETRRAAARKWEDEGHRDLSDLLEHLLTKYLNT